jgi:vacuolar-type H+-ATPase subunit H
VEDFPFAVAVGFLGAGVLTGLLLPRTRQEDKLIGEKSDQLIEQIKETGKESLEKAKTVAQRITQRTMDEAERQGITSEGAGAKISEIAGKIGAIATEAKQEALRAAEDVKPTAAPLSNEEEK